jgi:hypothetical protein
MTQPTAEQLLNLADRTPHGLTPDETARLRDGVAHHCARAEKAERAVDHLTDRYRGAEAELQQWRDTYGEHALRRTLARLYGAEAAIERVRAECDRIEAAVRDNPTSPDLAGGYLACLRHVRAALDEHQDPKP